MDYDIRKGLNPNRLTIAMWDFSWLNGHYPGGPYQDFDKVTDDLLERNFNTVRIDCFPLIIGRLKSESDLVTIKGNPLANWGVSDIDRSHCIVDELIQFMEITKKKGIHVILSTWNSGCLEFGSIREEYGKNVDDYYAAWDKTLKILESRGLLDNVLYIDLDQEFPYFSPYQEAIYKADNAAGCVDPSSKDLASDMEAAGRRDFGPNRLEWNPAQLEYVHNHLKSALDYFQNRYPRLRFTFSQTSFWKEVRATGLRSYDVLELHFWIHGPRFESRTGFNIIQKDRGDHDYRDYQRRINDALYSMRPMFLQDMHNQLQFATDWGREIAAPVVNTESWGPWWHMDHPHLTWDWLREWCAECNELAAKYGLWGTTPWNYCHPYWKNWSDVSWYREVNDAFLNSGSAV